MADLSTVVISVVGSLVPAGLVYLQSRNTNKQTQEKIDQEAFRAAKEFYSGTLEEYKEELSQSRQARKETEARLKDTLKELEQATTDRKFLELRVNALEDEKRDLSARITKLETKLRELGSDIPAPEEGNQ